MSISDARANDGELRRDGALDGATIADASASDAVTEASADATADAPIDDGTLWVFVTRERYQGNLGGLTAADALCQQAAERADLSGQFGAFLSDALTDARQRVPTGGPWRARSGATVFADHLDWEGVPAISQYGYDAKGNTNTVDYWTGSFFGATKSSATCESWTDDTDARGQFGSPAIDDWWIERSTSACSSEKSLLCFER